MKIRTNVRAGGWTNNHNEALVSDRPKANRPKVKTGIPGANFQRAR